MICLSDEGPRTLFANDASTERWSIKRPGGLTGDEVYVTGLAATMTDVLVRVENLDNTTQVTRVTPSSPSFVVAAAPSALDVTRTYLVLGVEHILFGVDHLLFVLALLILVKGWHKLVGTITAFTVAHSITLAAATLGFVHVPSKPVEATIALSIVFVACKIVHRGRGRSGLTEMWPWVIAFSFWAFARTRLRGRVTRGRPSAKRHPARSSFLQRWRGIGATSFHWLSHGGNHPCSPPQQEVQSMECRAAIHFCMV